MATEVKNMEEEYASITDRIFELINSRGITQRELSELTGISTSAISDWKHKGTIPSAANVKKICKALGVEPEQIIGSTNSDVDFVIGKNDDLYNFVKMYRDMERGMQKRVLAYVMAIMNAEK